MITNEVILLKVKQRLNKLASNDYDNITNWQIIEAYNKGCLLWVRRNLHGYNQFKEGDESSKRRITDLEVLLVEGKNIKVQKHDGYYDFKLPEDFLEWKSVSVKAKADCCDERRMMVYLSKVGDTGELLRNYNYKPNFEWGETFCTLSGNKTRIYTENKFEITTCEFSYFKLPNKIEIVGTSNPYTGAISNKDVHSEFKDDLIELFIDECVKILAGDIENITGNQLADNSVETNN